MTSHAWLLEAFGVIGNKTVLDIQGVTLAELGGI